MIDESAVLVLEAFLNSKLPVQYRSHLIRFNGDRPTKNIFNIEKKGESVLNRLFSLVSKRMEETLPYQINQYRNRIPSEMIPIGNDPGGNLILLALRGPKRGTIFFWEHDFESEEDSQSNYDNITEISNNFSDFMQALRNP